MASFLSRPQCVNIKGADTGPVFRSTAEILYEVYRLLTWCKNVQNTGLQNKF